MTDGKCTAVDASKRCVETPLLSVAAPLPTYGEHPRSLPPLSVCVSVCVCVCVCVGASDSVRIVDVVFIRQLIGDPRLLKRFEVIPCQNYPNLSVWQISVLSLSRRFCLGLQRNWLSRNGSFPR